MHKMMDFIQKFGVQSLLLQLLREQLGYQEIPTVFNKCFIDCFVWMRYIKNCHFVLEGMYNVNFSDQCGVYRYGLLFVCKLVSA
jgi:hypothetical protein